MRLTAIEGNCNRYVWVQQLDAFTGVNAVHVSLVSVLVAMPLAQNYCIRCCSGFTPLVWVGNKGSYRVTHTSMDMGTGVIADSDMVACD